MSVTCRQVEGIKVVEVTGTLDVDNSPRIRDAVLAELQSGGGRLVVDLSGVERVFSSGLSTLLTIHKAAAKDGGTVIFCGARPFFREVLRITMLDRVFHITSDPEAALDNLRAD